MKYVRQWFFLKSSKRGKRKKGDKWNREEVFDILKRGKMWKSKRGLVGSYFQSGTGNGRAVIHEKCNFWERSRFSFSLSARVWHPGPGNVAPFWMVPVLVPKKFGSGKKYRSRYRKNLVPEKSTGPGTGKILGTVTLWHVDWLFFSPCICCNVEIDVLDVAAEFFVRLL